ncbi:MAG: CAP domain-containing protein, partial [Nannocystis sp.]
MQLSTAPVDRYGAPVQHTLTAAEQLVVDGLGGGELRHEPGLSRAARELARTAPDRSTIPGALIDGVMAWVGLVDPSPRLGVMELPAGGAPCGEQVSDSCREALRSLIEATRKGNLGGQGVRWIGAGAATLPNGSIRVIVAVSERGVQLDPIANQVATGGQIKLHGRLLGRRTRPSIELVDAEGRWSTLPARVSKNEFTADVVCDRGRGAYQVEVLAEGAYGPEVVANFPLYCGVKAPRVLRVEIERVDAGVDAADVTRSNFAALNATRERQGLAPLQWDNGAATVATAHSLDMLSNNFVGHDSPRTGDVENRFRRAGIVNSVLRENVARGYGPRGIHQSLMMSPGHRINILATDVTHVGIGAVIGPPESDSAGAPRPVFLTQNFFAKIGADLPADPIAALRERVDSSRKAAGLPALVWDSALFGPSQALAEGIAAGKKAAAEATYNQQLEKLPYKTVQH